MFKIIVKTALKVLLALLILAVIAFAAVSLAAPKTMAEFFEKQGNYSFAKGYMSLQYTYSGNVDDLAHFVQDCIQAEDDNSTSKMGEKLVVHDGFKELCERETERLGVDYRHYICGKIACAKYRLGDKDGAIKFAKDKDYIVENGEFSKNNALVQLMVEVTKANDKDGAQQLKSAIGKIECSGEYRSDILAALEKVING